MNRSSVDINSRISVQLAIIIVAFCCTVVIAEGQLKLTSIKPTVFFVHKDNVLTQLGEATINNLSQKEVEIALQSQIPGKRMQKIPATVPKGTTVVKFSFPNISEPTPVTLIRCSNATHLSV